MWYCGTITGWGYRLLSIFLSLFLFVLAATMGFADFFYYLYLLQLNEDKSPFQRIFVNQVLQLTVFFISRFHFCVDGLVLPAPIF